VDRTAGELLGRLESHLLAMICHDFYESAHATNTSPRFFNTIFGIIFASAMFYFEGAQGSGIATLQKTLGKYSRHQQTSADISRIDLGSLPQCWSGLLCLGPLGLRVARFRLFGGPTVHQ